MGDYTGFHITVHRITKHKKKFKAAILEVVGQWVEFTNEPNEFVLGQGIDASEIRCGTVDGLSKQLIDLDPQAIWSMYEEPKYEWLGTVAHYHPDYGLFLGECDASGNVLLDYTKIAETGILTSPESDVYTIASHLEAQGKLDVLLGLPQQHAIADLTNQGDRS